MRKFNLLHTLAFVLSVMLVLSSIPFAGASANQSVTYQMPVSKIEANDVPIAGDNYFIVENVLYDKNGDAIKTFSAKEVPYTLGNDCVITVCMDNSANGKYYVYSIKDGRCEFKYEYDTGATAVMPYDLDGEYTTAIFEDGFEVWDSTGKYVYLEHIVNTFAVYVGEGIVAAVDEEGNHSLIYGFDTTVTKKPIEGYLCSTFNGGLAVYYVLDENGNERYGFIDAKGEALTEAKYAHAFVTENGYGVMYDDFVGTSDMGDGIYVIDNKGKMLHSDVNGNYELIEYYDGYMLICDPFGTYAIQEIGNNAYPASGYYSYSELDCHFFAHDEKSAGKVTDNYGNVILENVLDFSAESVYGDDRISGDIIAKSADDGKYHRYRADGREVCAYSAETLYALIDGLAVAGDEKFENVYIVDIRERQLTSKHDYYLGSEIYEGCSVILMADESQDDLTYSVYIFKASLSPFDDVAEDHWAAKYIADLYRVGVMNGTGGLSFSPDSQVTRAQVVTMLWRLAGEPKATGSEYHFVDVPEKTWYTEAVAWAAEKGITTGVGGAYFAPDRVITRGEFATLRYRVHLIMSNIPQDDLTDPTGFADVSELTDWNREAIAYCVANGIITGKPKEGKVFLAPNDVLTRAESAAILWRSGIH